MTDPQRDTALASCPFCGSTDASPDERKIGVPAPPDYEQPYFVLVCDNCGAQGPWTSADVEHARSLWNLRAVAVEGQ